MARNAFYFEFLHLKALLIASYIALFIASTAIAQTFDSMAHHGIAMHGKPTLSAGEAFGYTDPRPIQGGEISFAKLGSFDSLNPFIIRGQAAFGLREFVYESLLVRHFDEPFALYGLLAERVSTPEDRSSVTFYINKSARFSDGQPVTVEDVIFSFETLRDKGRPNHRYYYGKVETYETEEDHTITFRFNPDDQDFEMPLIMGLMPILPKHFFAGQDFSKTNLSKPIGSGPYIVAEVDAGKKITYEKNSNYWGNSLAVNQGRHNIRFLHYDYYRDENAAFEAFKSGLVDVWEETNPIRWARGYDFPAARDGRIIKENIQTGVPSGLYGFVFNTRRPIFENQNVRKALANLFNFEWVNKTLYAGAYTRTQSYFQKSDLSSYNQAASAAEKKLLRKSQLPRSLIENGYKAAIGDPTGRNRAARANSIALLKDAGYDIVNGRMVHTRTNAPLNFEIIVQSRENERLAIAYKQMLSRIGVGVTVRFIDTTQYQNRLQTFDYDMMIYNWYASLSPGNEQAFYWGSDAAEQNGSRNYPGIKNKHIDSVIENMTRASTRQEFATAARALDRLLMGGDYVVPLFHQPTQWLARWHQVEHSWRHALYGAKFDSWWINPDN